MQASIKDLSVNIDSNAHVMALKGCEQQLRPYILKFYTLSTFTGEPFRIVLNMKETQAHRLFVEVIARFPDEARKILKEWKI